MKTHLYVTGFTRGANHTLCNTKSDKVADDISEVDCKRCQHYYFNEDLPLVTHPTDNAHCGNCGRLIEVQIFKNTGRCCNICKDALENKEK